MAIEKSELEKLFKRKRARSSHKLFFYYRNYIRDKKLIANHRIICTHGDLKLAFTQKQFTVLKLVALGFSNVKIAKRLGIKESTTKLLIYRIMKYLESVLYKRIDRFSLVIVAQELDFTSPIKPVVYPAGVNVKYN